MVQLQCTMHYRLQAPSPSPPRHALLLLQDSGASMEQVVQASMAANAHGFISKLPNGWGEESRLGATCVELLAASGLRLPCRAGACRATQVAHATQPRDAPSPAGTTRLWARRAAT